MSPDIAGGRVERRSALPETAHRARWCGTPLEVLRRRRAGGCSPTTSVAELAGRGYAACDAGEEEPTSPRRSARGHRARQGGQPPHPSRAKALGCPQQRRLSPGARACAVALREAHQGAARKGPPEPARLVALPQREVLLTVAEKQSSVAFSSSSMSATAIASERRVAELMYRSATMMDEAPLEPRIWPRSRMGLVSHARAQKLQRH